MDQVEPLTQRQIHILRSVIEEYIETAEPVGSETIEKKYNVGVSPATIRNEMVELTTMGYLMKPHSSAGRSPTPKALKYYVQNLMKTKDMSIAEEVAVKEQMWDYRQQVDKLLRESTKMLSQKTKTLAVTVTNSGDIYYAGAAHILDMPEFFDYQLTHSVLETLDQFDYWWRLLQSNEDPFDILLGDELGGKSLLSQCGYVYSKFESPRVSGAIGVVGPSRLNYPVVIPVVRYMGGLIDEFTSSL